jgi:hypothetical protein
MVPTKSTGQKSSGQQKKLIVNGQEVDVRDEDVYQQQKDPNSHLKYFEQNFSAADGKQKLKRMDKLTKQLEQLVSERVDPGASACIRIIKDEEYFRFNQMYMECVKADELDRGTRARDCEFQPLSTYQHKITRARPILKGEVGMHGNQILRLEPGYGEGQLVNVPEQLVSGNADTTLIIKGE